MPGYRLACALCVTLIFSLSLANQLKLKHDGHLQGKIQNPSESEKWNGGLVPYEMDSRFPHEFQKKVLQVIDDFEANTCIKFAPRAVDDKRYLKIELDESKCSTSQTCSQNGPQTILLGINCITRHNFAHALGHSLCLNDEDSRADRDQHLELADCEEGNAPHVPDKLRWQKFHDSLIYYDLLSIMHFSQCEGSCLKPKNATLDSCGGAQRLSLLDVEKINKLYGCRGCLSYQFMNNLEFTLLDLLRNILGHTEKSTLIAGKDLDRLYLGVCRTLIDGHIIPGKLRYDSNNSVEDFGKLQCHIAWNEEISKMSKFEVLLLNESHNFRWIRSENLNSSKAVPGGRKKNGSPIYIARCLVAGANNKTLYIPGRLDEEGMVYAYDGQQFSCKNFEVLACASNASKGVKVKVRATLMRTRFLFENSSKNHSICDSLSFKPVKLGLQDVLIAATDTDHSKLGICRAKVDNNFIPGKVKVLDEKTTCYVSHLEEIKFMKDFEILTIQNSSRFRWIPHHNFTNHTAVVAGQTAHKTPVNIARCHMTYISKKLLVPGKLQDGKMWYPFGWKEDSCTNFDILVCSEDSSEGSAASVLEGYVNLHFSTTSPSLHSSSFSMFPVRFSPRIAVNAREVVVVQTTTKSTKKRISTYEMDDGLKIGLISFAILFCICMVFVIVKCNAAKGRLHNPPSTEVQERHQVGFTNIIFSTPETTNVGSLNFQTSEQ